jgi:hypothetical protein
MAETTREPTKATPERLAAFLNALAETANVTTAAQSVDLNRQYLYVLRDDDEAFAKSWDAAVKIGTAALEDEATRRAKEGWDEPVFYQGAECGSVRKFSDTLLIFLLKARDPKFREKLDVAGPNGGPIPVANTHEVIDPAEAARRYQQLMDAPE